jgi:hypothetical protein
MPYQILCDSAPIYDYRDETLILQKPRVKVAVNSCGEASFVIFADHPRYNYLRELASLFEVKQDGETIFRGRMTNNGRDFNNAKEVDIEGVMAFFNDSVVRPFAFPEDFQNDAAYKTAAASGNVVAFFLGWLIDNHNEQVQDFQKLKLGTVTVRDANNYLTRENEDYANTWETLESKLFGSALGGYLCPRYEADGTYIDYLADFTETNTQKIVYGENLLDLTSETDATETFTAVLPLGEKNDATEKRLTIAGLADGYVGEGIYKRGDYLYKKDAAEAVGLIFAPIQNSTFDDITTAVNLRKKGVELLSAAARFTERVTYNAFDLHLTDKQIESFRIYKKVEAFSRPHGQDGKYILSELDIDIESPQATKITVGGTERTLIDITRAKQENAVQRVQIVSGDLKKTVAAQQQTIVKIQADVAERPTETGVVSIINGTVNADYVNALKITIETAQINGKLTASQINGDGLNVKNGVFDTCTINSTCTINGALKGGTLAQHASNLASGEIVYREQAASIDFSNAYYEFSLTNKADTTKRALFKLNSDTNGDTRASVLVYAGASPVGELNITPNYANLRHDISLTLGGSASSNFLNGVWKYKSEEVATAADIAALSARIAALGG